MLIKFCVDEDFVNYKKPSMFLGTPYCSFKCNREAGEIICQNEHLRAQPVFNIDDDELIQRYLNNDLTEAIIFGGFEPLDSFDELLTFLTKFRKKCSDDIVIYTGYTEEECKTFEHFSDLINFKNLIIKYGRYVAGEKPHFDMILGVNLASNNQYAKIY